MVGTTGEHAVLPNEALRRRRQVSLSAGCEEYCGLKNSIVPAERPWTAPSIASINLSAGAKSRRRLAAARDHKERIFALLAFLSELDTLTEAESDRSVFEELALLFIEIASSAEAGAAALREL